MSLKPQVLEFEDRWYDVKKVVLDILAGNSVDKKVWTSSFSDVYALCTAVTSSHAPRLYIETKKLFKDHVESVLKNLKNAENEEILKGYCAYWEIYEHACNVANNLFSYLNTQCQKQQNKESADKCEPEENFIQGFMVISDTGLKLWSETLLMDCAKGSGDKDESLRCKLINLVLEEISKNRQGSFIGNQDEVLKTINSFQGAESYKTEEEERLKLFEKSLEEPYLQQVKNFYRQKSLDLMDSLDVQEYIARCLQLLEEEGWRAKKFMVISYDKIISATRQMLVLDHLDFINSHCRAMIESQNEEALSNTYQLLHFSSRAISHMLNEYQDYIEKRTQDVFKNFKEDNLASNLCESLIDIHEHQTKLIKKVFLSYPGFITSLDKGFNNTINKFSRNNGPSHQKSAIKVSPVPDLLVRHCDQLLKKGAKGLNENDLDDKLAGVVTIFKYIEDKDVFNKIYSKHLARRLIYFQSQSMDAEEVMIKKLKQVCGHEYTGKLQRMLTDIKISEDLATKFVDSLGSDPSICLGLSFNILVMQAGAWPLQVPQSSFTIPQELERSLQQFEKFYQVNFNGRKLLWHHALSTCDVKFNHLSRTYVMHTSVHIMSIIVLFNNVDTMTFAEISTTTGIGQDDLLRYLQLLVDNDIMLCDNKKLSTESRFMPNFNYQNKRPKFKLMSQFRESAQETERTLNTVTEDRKMFLQAVIVRTMKARKKLHHKALVEEVVRQSLRHFVPNHSFIKKMIEQLIDKQYLERVEDSIDEYNYIA